MIEVQYKRDRTTLGNFANVSEKGIAHKIMFAGMDGNNRRSICRFCFIHDCAKEIVIRHIKCANGKAVLAGRLQLIFSYETNMLNLQFQRVVRPAGALLHWHKGHDRK